ncbi:hypothetical protein B0J17DRAFT_773735 [Rhizoctonia solani]|nr:hypothetical protein B0J17DRAFT_773735 [Rhizoctonia solani]
MAPHAGWYPASQVCYPPKLPPYLKNVHNLQPIAGVPSDAEVIGIHAVILAANRASGIPGMHDPNVFRGLAEHLFNAQMARYRDKYSLITLPSDSTYTPPTLPSHISVELKPILGVPSDEELTGVQEAVRSYQQFSHAPSMFDPHVNMELSQHLFDVHMARYMRRAGDSEPNPVPQETTLGEIPVEINEQIPNSTGEAITTDAQSTAEFRATNTGYELDQQPQVTSQDISTRKVMERSNQLVERLGKALDNINGVLAGIQHTMIRGQFGLGGAVKYNLHTMACLVNYKGEHAATMGTLTQANGDDPASNVDFHLKSDPYSVYIPATQLAAHLKFYGLDEGLCCEEDSELRLKDGMEALARKRLGDYLTGCVG